MNIKELSIKEANNKIDEIDNKLEYYLNKKELEFIKTQPKATDIKAEITTAGNYVNVSFTKLLRICPRVNTTIAVGSLPSTTTGTTTLTSTETEIPVIKDANFIIRKVAS